MNTSGWDWETGCEGSAVAIRAVVGHTDPDPSTSKLEAGRAVPFHVTSMAEACRPGTAKERVVPSAATFGYAKAAGRFMTYGYPRIAGFASADLGEYVARWLRARGDLEERDDDEGWRR